MASKYLQSYPIPSDFAEILSNFAREVLRDQPEDIIEYGAQYFEALQAGKKWQYESKTNVPNPNPQSHYIAQPRNNEQKTQVATHKREPSQDKPSKKTDSSYEKSGHLRHESQEKSIQSETSHPEEKLIARGYLADLETGVLNKPSSTTENLESNGQEDSQAEAKKFESIIEEDQHDKLNGEAQSSKFDHEEPVTDHPDYKYIIIGNGERLAYKEAGEENERPLILLHGLLSSSEIWTPIIPHLAKNYHVYAIDLRGSGHSTYRSKLFHMRDLADDILQFMEALEIESASFVGHYTGAAVAMTFAFRYTYKVQKLVVLEPLSIKGHAYGGKEAKDYQADDFANDPTVAPINTALTSHDTSHIKDMLVNDFFSGNPPSAERLESLLQTAFNCKSYLDLLYIMSRYNISNESNGIVEGNGGISLIESDVLIVHGADDKVVPLEVSKEIQDVLGPKAELITIEKGSHAISDSDADGIATNIIEFLDRAPSVHKYIKLPNGETIAYMESGIYNEKVIVCLHSNLASSQSWDILFPKLENDFHVVAVDLRGFGRSSYVNKVADLKDFATDIEAFIEAKELGKVTFLGDFLGAGIALLVAISKPELVEKLILLGPVPSKGFSQKIEGVENPQPEDFLKDPTIGKIHQAIVDNNNEFFTEWLAETRKGGQPDEERYAKYRSDVFLCRAYLDVLFALGQFNVSSELSNVQSQTLILHGENDNVVPKDTAEELAKEIGDKAKLTVVPGGDHSFLEGNLDFTVDNIVQFLKH